MSSVVCAEDLAVKTGGCLVQVLHHDAFGSIHVSIGAAAMRIPRLVSVSDLLGRD